MWREGGHCPQPTPEEREQRVTPQWENAASCSKQWKYRNMKNDLKRCWIRLSGRLGVSLHRRDQPHLISGDPTNPDSGTRVTCSWLVSVTTKGVQTWGHPSCAFRGQRRHALKSDFKYCIISTSICHHFECSFMAWLLKFWGRWVRDPNYSRCGGGEWGGVGRG